MSTGATIPEYLLFGDLELISFHNMTIFLNGLFYFVVSLRFRTVQKLDYIYARLKRETKTMQSKTNFTLIPF